MADDALPFDPTRKPDLDKPGKRKPLTRVQFATLILAQSGLCGCGCGKKLQADRIIDEHVVALDFLGSNDLSNRSLWDRDCSKAKTAKDLAASAKGKRLRQETGNGPKRQIPSRPLIATNRSEAPGKWQSAGFDKTKTRGFDGKIRERAK